MALNVLDVIKKRRTMSRLETPGPNARELAEMLSAAAQAPDHGNCRPWRFIVVTGNARADFGDVLADAYAHRCRLAGDDPDPAAVRRERVKPLRAPTLVVVGFEPVPDTRIPVHEQRAAVAAATQNLLLAATALGYGSKWSTGAAATDPCVAKALGISDSGGVVGFVYLGSLPADRTDSRPPRNVDTAAVVRRWQKLP